MNVLLVIKIGSVDKDKNIITVEARSLLCVLGFKLCTCFLLPDLFARAVY